MLMLHSLCLHKCTADYQAAEEHQRLYGYRWEFHDPLKAYDRYDRCINDCPNISTSSSRGATHIEIDKSCRESACSSAGATVKDKAIRVINSIVTVFPNRRNDKYDKYFSYSEYPLEVLITMLDTKFTSRPWQQVVPNCLQLAFGLLITARFIFGGPAWVWLIFAPLGMVFFGSLCAVPLWLLALCGLVIFKGVLIAGGLVTYFCSYAFGAKVVLEKILDLNFHQVADKAAQNVARRIFS